MPHSENQDARLLRPERGLGVLENDACDGQALLFTAAQTIATLAHNRVVAVGQANNQFVDIGGAAGRIQLGLRRARSRVKQVGANGVVEQV